MGAYRLYLFRTVQNIGTSIASRRNQNEVSSPPPGIVKPGKSNYKLLEIVSQITFLYFVVNLFFNEPLSTYHDCFSVTVRRSTMEDHHDSTYSVQTGDIDMVSI
jgi:hypothetical protein